MMHCAVHPLFDEREDPGEERTFHDALLEEDGKHHIGDGERADRTANDDARNGAVRKPLVGHAAVGIAVGRGIGIAVGRGIGITVGRGIGIVVAK